jgi:hypothetical protein
MGPALGTAERASMLGLDWHLSDILARLVMHLSMVAKAASAVLGERVAALSALAMDGTHFTAPCSEIRTIRL